ncbi:MAG: hypothetical protein ACOC7N_01430 [Chloroflexota bacterium]
MLPIGVVGHRFLTELDKVTAGVDEALDRIEAAFGEPLPAVISSLAEGADRLVLRRVLARCPDARLIVPLPLPQSDYMKDFSSPESREAFLDLLSRADQVVTLPPAPTREEAYAAGGYYVLDHCDVLLAVWDGKEGQGTGGTAGIVAEARHRHLPLTWVHAGNRIPGTRRPTTLGEEQGRVTVERLPAGHSQQGCHNGP